MHRCRGRSRILNPLRTYPYIFNVNENAPDFTVAEVPNRKRHKGVDLPP